MTPKEKAIELVAKYKTQSFGITTNFQHYKQCALIAVDEILKENIELPEMPESIERYNYWIEVKQEIESL